MVTESHSKNPATRLAAVDCGSNAIRMVIAEWRGPEELAVLESERVAVRLGHGVFTRGEIDRLTLDQAVAAFAHFRERFDAHGVTRYRAVATSAVRDAHNRDILLHRLYHEAEMELDVIDGDEEARLVRKAVMHAFASTSALRPTPRLVLDLGGGSLEINVRHHGGWRSVSLPVGTVRLMESFGLTGAIGHEEAGMVRRYAGTLLQEVQSVTAGALVPAAACGGNAEALARICGGVDETRMPEMTLDSLELALPEILACSVAERMARFDVRQDRAEVMGVAALVLATVCRGLQIPKLAAPGVGIRDALLLELAEALPAPRTTAASARDKALLTGARAFAQRMGHDLTHGEHVRALCRAMFDQLADLHKIPGELGVILEIAALLHDVGEVVNPASHHKHSEYLISWGRLPGLGSPLRELVALLARTHRKSPPDAKKHPLINALPKSLRPHVRPLAAILRLADSLDTEHRQAITGVLVNRLGQTITLDLLVANEEIKASIDPEPLLRKRALFEQELGHQVVFTLGTAAPIG